MVVCVRSTVLPMLITPMDEKVNEHVQCANADAELPNEDFGQCTENNACQFVVAEAMHRFNLLQSQCLCVSHQW